MWVTKKTKTILTALILSVFSFCTLSVATPTHTYAASLPAAPTSFADGAVEAPDCESGGLSWLFCQLINGMSNASDFLINTFIVPMLQTSPIDLSDPESGVFKAWSSFRIIANILLVVALLVIVIGQAAGSEIAAAYVAKKSIPRLLVAAVLINLSIYIVAAAVDITNIIGMGIGDLMTAPFKDNGHYVFQVNGAVGALGSIGTGSAIIATTIASIFLIIGKAAALKFLIGPMQFILLFILLPIIMAIIAVFVTLIIRMGMIVFLIMVSPVAFALYTLPNTEQYFKKWWSLLIKTLMVYPIVIVVISVTNILSVIVSDTNSGSDAKKMVASLVGLVLIFLPLFIIPFAFQLAGGVVSEIAGKAAGFGKRGTEAIKGSEHDPNSLRNRVRTNARDGVTRGREAAWNGLSNVQGRTNSRIARRGIGALGRAVAYGDLEARRSDLNKREAERRDLKTSYGPDSSVRALFAKQVRNPDTGQMEWRSITNGKKFSDMEVANARRQHGGNIAAAQAALDYEVTKAGNADEYNNLRNGAAAQLHSLGFTQGDIKGAMTGANFKNQGYHLSGKYDSHEYDSSTGQWTRTNNAHGLAQEVAQKKGSYAQMQLSEVTWQDMADNHQKAVQAVASGDLSGTSFKSVEEAQQTIDNHQLIAAGLREQKRGSRQVGGAEGEAPIMGSGGSGAPAHVQRAMDAFEQSVLGDAPAPAPREPLDVRVVENQDKSRP